MSWLTFGTKQLLSEVAAQVKAQTRLIASVLSDVQQLAHRVEDIRQDERRRFDALLKEYVQIAAAPKQPASQSVRVTQNVGLFDEVPLNDPEGYKLDDLLLGGSYAEARAMQHADRKSAEESSDRQ